jgi:hypothetical protein
VLNRARVWPAPGGPPTRIPEDGADARARPSLAFALASPPGDPRDAEAAATAAIAAAAEYASWVRRDEEATRGLRVHAEQLGCFFRRVPELPRDVHDLDGLVERFGDSVTVAGDQCLLESLDASHSRVCAYTAAGGTRNRPTRELVEPRERFGLLIRLENLQALGKPVRVEHVHRDENVLEGPAARSAGAVVRLAQDVCTGSERENVVVTPTEAGRELELAAPMHQQSAAPVA